MVGTQVRHYEIQSLIGDGGMGAVYLAKDLKLGRPAALKVLLPELLRVPDLRQRLAQEARVQGRLNHPGIVAVYEFDAEAGHIVMEYVDGRPLDDVIVDVGGPLPLPFIKRTLRQIAQALDYAHAYRDEELTQGIVHRDIKPANILIRQTGEESLAKVTDFGVARIVGDARRLTATGSQMGTLWYMSPEQVKSPKDVDFRSDIYALGVLLYEMLTGSVPFDGDSDFNIMSNIVEGAPPPLQTHTAEVSPRLEAVLAKALHKNPEDRFQSCIALYDAFESAAAPEPTPVSDADETQAPPPQHKPIAERLQDLSPEEKTLYGVGALVILLLILLAGVWGAGSSPRVKALAMSSPEDTVRAWARANGQRNTEEMMTYYGDAVQWYNKRVDKYELFLSKSRYHKRFYSRSDVSIDNLTTRYNDTGTEALVEYDSIWYWAGDEDDVFWFDARRRVRLKQIDGQWLIVCEEEAMVRSASNPKAEGTEICNFGF